MSYIKLNWHTVTINKGKYVKFEWKLYIVSDMGDIPVEWMEQYIEKKCVVVKGVWKIRLLSI